MYKYIINSEHINYILTRSVGKDYLKFINALFKEACKGGNFHAVCYFARKFQEDNYQWIKDVTYGYYGPYFGSPLGPNCTGFRAVNRKSGNIMFYFPLNNGGHLKVMLQKEPVY